MTQAPCALQNLDLGLIGNCHVSALVDGKGSIVWSCFPRLDSEPIFDELLDNDSGEGCFAIELDGLARAERAYLDNTAVLRTRLFDHADAALEIIDFVPRFELFGRMHRPTTIIRMLTPLTGHPRIRIRLRPRFGYGVERPQRTRGSHHVRFVGESYVLRLQTDAPIVYVSDETWFRLDRPIALVLGADERLTAPVEQMARDALERTLGYWRTIANRLHVPFEWQREVIRSAITLKLCTFEETGAIVAAHTTSLPEAQGEGRNWDYRFCWLRDAFFVVRTLNRLGYIETMAQYLVYLRNLVADSPDGFLQPVYGIAREALLRERVVDTLQGYRGNRPVRVGNEAFEHHQHDGYGSVILAVSQAFFDTRLRQPVGHEAFQELERAGEKAWQLHDVPDAGLWEFRTFAGVHTHSSMMCWAACDRLARIAAHLRIPARAQLWAERAHAIHELILNRAWNEKRQTFTATFDGEEVDAALLLMPMVGFVAAHDARFLATLKVIERDLVQGPYVFRYRIVDDFGIPENAFLICSFWYIDVLARIGRVDQARELFEHLLTCRNSLGLMTEHIHIASRELWGNIPQTYSHVGLIECAMRLSRAWDDVV